MNKCIVWGLRKATGTRLSLKSRVIKITQGIVCCFSTFGLLFKEDYRRLLNVQIRENIRRAQK